MHKGRARNVAIGIAGGVVVLGVAAAAPWSVSGETMTNAIAARIERATGFNVQASGRATFALLPRPRVKVEGVTIRSPDGALVVDSQSIKGDLALLPLLTGHIDVDALTLVTPTISVNGDGQILNAGRPASTDAPSTSLGTLSIVSGLARFHHPSTGFETLIEDINLRVDWQSLSAPASLSGSLSWRGENETIAGVVSTPMAVRAGGMSPMTIKIGGRALTLDADGILAGGSSPRYKGHVSASTQAPSALARLAGVAGRWSDGVRRARFDASADVSREGAALTDARFTMDGSDVQGSLMVGANQDGWLASGTLASNKLDLTPFAALWPTLVAQDGSWSRDPLEFDAWPTLDLRLSAGHARIGRFDLADAGLSIMLSGAPRRNHAGRCQSLRRLGQRPANGDSCGGRARHAGERRPHTRRCGRLARGWMEQPRMAGDLTGQFTLTALGDTPAALSRSLAGHAQLTMQNGELSGIDLEEALRRVEKRPLSIIADVRNGRTPFATLEAGLDIKSGVATVESCWASGPGIALAMTGTAHVADRTLDLQSIARQARADAVPSETGPQLRLGVAGPWDDLALVLDTDGLIRSSGAAAPLLRKTPPRVTVATP